MTSVVVNTDVDQPPVNDDLSDSSLMPPQSTMQSKAEIEGKVCGHHGGTCAICLDKKIFRIPLL